MKQSQPKAFWISLFFFLALSLVYQNCTPVRMSPDSPLSSTKTENGGPYSGVQKLYQQIDDLAPCSEKDRNGKPLPNLIVLFKPDIMGTTQPYLARENCSDLKEPSLISASDLQVTQGPPITVSYKNKLLNVPPTPGDFDVVAAQCPAGRTAIPAALRTNLVTASLDWTVPRTPGFGWVFMEGIQTSLHSTLQSLPAYLIERNDPAHLEHFQRATQYIALKPSTQYAFSFLAQGGTVPGADVNIYRSFTTQPAPTDETVLMSFNFQTLSVKVEWANNMGGAVTGTVVPFGNGYLCTAYFTTSANTNPKQMDIGVSSSTFGSMTGQLGDSIVATAGQLVEVNQYCQ